ncbi:hypothetical protein FKM82_024590 [Ascaphus truei]
MDYIFIYIYIREVTDAHIDVTQNGSITPVSQPISNLVGLHADVALFTSWVEHTAEVFYFLASVNMGIPFLQ